MKIMVQRTIQSATARINGRWRRQLQATDTSATPPSSVPRLPPNNSFANAHSSKGIVVNDVERHARPPGSKTAAVQYGSSINMSGEPTAIPATIPSATASPRQEKNKPSADLPSVQSTTSSARRPPNNNPYSRAVVARP